MAAIIALASRNALKERRRGSEPTPRVTKTQASLPFALSSTSENDVKFGARLRRGSDNTGRMQAMRQRNRRGSERSLGSIERGRFPKGSADIFGNRSGSLILDDSIGESVASFASRIRRRGRRCSLMEQKIPPLTRFRRAGRVVHICVVLSRFSFQRAEEVKGQLLSITQFSDEPLVPCEDLLFDVSIYKATRHERVSQEARRILKLMPEKRTEKDLKYLQIALRNINAFAEYPKRMQIALCRVGWYESYESKRAIVRQGHPPVAFYFILSGTVVVTVYDKEAQVARTICFLHRGMEFGELALVTRSIRQATVISKTPIELLCVSVEDFEDIFMDGGMKTVLDPDHVAFLKNIPFMHNWPIEKLQDEPRKCLFHFFNRGQVLVRDSNYSDWIYIVKSGSLSVMKKLKQVHPNLRDSSDTPTDSDDSPRNTKKKKQVPKVPDRPPPRTLYEWEKRLEESLPGIHDRRERLGTIDYESIIEERIQQFRESRHQRHSTYLPPILKPTNETLEEIQEGNLDLSEDEEEKPIITKTAKGVFLSTGKRKKPVSRLKKERKKMSKKLEALEAQVKRGQDTIGRKTLADDLDNKPTIIPFGRDDMTEADKHPTFILVQVLERGQYFGVSQMVFRDQPNLSLVSNGAECIMISKKYFKLHSNETIMRDLRRQEIPYPMQDEMQANLQNSINWESHRAKTYKTIADLVQAKKLRKRQLLPLSVENLQRTSRL